ncbi:MAG: hypothetical protein VYC17_01835, partial [Nitrospinota bacterium]|nr:hypothetical protein [Nitrospinota bacterium]
LIIISEDYPVARRGPLTFIALYPDAISQTKLVARPSYIQKRPPHAHSFYIKTLSDSGLVGSEMLIVLLVSLFK